MNKLILIPLSIVILIAISCKEKLPLDKDLTKKSYNLINQEGEARVFPDFIKGTDYSNGFHIHSLP